jgi:imidazolonepropionase-like amidohydrolase
MSFCSISFASPSAASAPPCPLAAVSPQADGAEVDQNHGYRRQYTIHADHAWLPDGRVLSPAYVTLSNGVIARISSKAPQEQKNLFGGSTKPKVIKVSGTLAPGVVDAWSGIIPVEVRLDRRPLPYSDMTDDLPVNLDGADQALSTMVGAERASGVAATYIGRADGNLQRGLGVAVGFSAYDLPYESGHQFFDLTVTGDALAVQTSISGMRDMFQEAIDWRDSLADFDDKMEKYEESLKKYQEELDKFVEEKKKEDGEKDDSQTKAEGDKEKAKKEKKRPKRPSRPRKPTDMSARNLVLDAIDGKRPVRVHAESAAAIRAAIALQEEHGFQLLVVGGSQAVDCRFELAKADVGVVLDLNRINRKSNGRTFKQQFQMLLDAEVSVALSSGGRNLGPMLLTYAGELVAQGADATDVWASLTSTPAGLLGLESSFGRIGRGRSGSMILFGGKSPFDASGSFQAHKPK